MRMRKDGDRLADIPSGDIDVWGDGPTFGLLLPHDISNACCSVDPTLQSQLLDGDSGRLCSPTCSVLPWMVRR